MEHESAPAANAAPAPARAAAPHPDYAITALVLQGGGALGAYQAGVYEGLVQGGIHPNWVAGISIGALNAAIIAGNAPEQRVVKLRGFWEQICRQPWWPPLHRAWAGSGEAALGLPSALRAWFDSLESARSLLEGQNGFFQPRLWPMLGGAGKGPHHASFYDTAPLRATLETFADFDRINHADQMRVSVGAGNVRTGNFVFFDNRGHRLRPEHFMASAALPPGFPAVEVDGEFYWDGGLVSNTPLHHVLGARPRQDALIFQIDLWSAAGAVPTDLMQVAVRQKDIQFSSRTRMVTSMLQEEQHFRRLLHEALERIPESARDNDWYREAAKAACDARRNVIHLIYRDKPYEGYAKDFQFGVLSMNEHWSTGLADFQATLRHRHWLDRPGADHPFVTHDLHRHGSA
jgi:NTE family protein